MQSAGKKTEETGTLCTSGREGPPVRITGLSLVSELLLLVRGFDERGKDVGRL